MRYAFAFAALFAAAAVAKPVDFKAKHKRDLVIETVYDLVYEYVYVTAGGAAPAASTQLTTTTTTAETTSTASAEAQQAPPNHANPPSPEPTTTVAAVKTTAAAQPATAAGQGGGAAKPATAANQGGGAAQPATAANQGGGAAQSATAASQAGSGSQASAPAQAASTAAHAAPPSTATSYQEIVLLHHNVHRANHSAPNVAWSSELAAVANQLASGCVYEHNTQIPFSLGGYGQNIGAGSPPDQVSDMITDLMYNGEMPYYAGYYGDVNPPFNNFEHFGHFTQIVWKATTLVGCATVQCGSVSGVGNDVAPYLTVCNYYPPGNMGGEYGENIGEPLGEPSINGNYGL